MPDPAGSKFPPAVRLRARGLLGRGLVKAFRGVGPTGVRRWLLAAPACGPRGRSTSPRLYFSAGLRPRHSSPATSQLASRTGRAVVDHATGQWSARLPCHTLPDRGRPASAPGRPRRRGEHGRQDAGRPCLRQRCAQRRKRATPAPAPGRAKMRPALHPRAQGTAPERARPGPPAPSGKSRERPQRPYPGRCVAPSERSARPRTQLSAGTGLLEMTKV